MIIFNYIILCDPTTYHNPFLEEFRLIIIQLKYNIMDYNGKSVKTLCSSWSQHRTPALNTRSDVHTKKPILQFIMFGLWKKIAFQLLYKVGFKITGHKKHNFEISNFFSQIGSFYTKSEENKNCLEIYRIIMVQFFSLKSQPKFSPEDG